MFCCLQKVQSNSSGIHASAINQPGNYRFHARSQNNVAFEQPSRMDAHSIWSIRTWHLSAHSTYVSCRTLFCHPKLKSMPPGKFCVSSSLHRKLPAPLFGGVFTPLTSQPWSYLLVFIAGQLLAWYVCHAVCVWVVQRCLWARWVRWRSFGLYVRRLLSVVLFFKRAVIMASRLGCCFV